MRGVLTAAIVALALPSTGMAASTQVPIEPEEKERYPVLTLFTGPCTPEEPLREPDWAPDSAHQEERTLESVYSLFTANGDDYALIAPTEGRNNRSGPCQADRNPQLVGDVAAFKVEGTGNMHMTVNRRRQKYQSGSSGFDPVWVAPDAPVDDVPRSVAFTVFDPCSFTVAGVSRTVRKFTAGKRTPVTVRRGDTISRGDFLEVDPGGKAALSNPVLGNGIGFGPGTYRFTSNEECEAALKGRTPSRMPDDLPPVQLEEGVIDQRGREAASTVKAAGGLLNDGIFSRLRERAPRAAGAAGEVRFRVQRSKRRKQTRSCAIKGQLRVTTTSRRVPAAKRRLIVPQGRCAVTRDRAQPKLARR